MQMVDMFFQELEDAKKRKVPFIIPIGTIEYHALHASCGTDTMVITGVLRELEKTKRWWCVRPFGMGWPVTQWRDLKAEQFMLTWMSMRAIFIVS